ncbi:hypothetical protein BDP55DRAFT_657731 [Colletotrichum godetiae]|uniref:Uncharacterized protein n=1 Tax=Colletotrichum godetiae TaxID=1209918 RepID=A0AAJ0ASW2_9PEZI|nr:uncharacterized protein BDP55DRAFT_657731 [Colletotrichum godetiae]KAK1688351.1 hypothetical protein BDP55DRAFT_657731 [Colletotrichum godetiae]
MWTVTTVICEVGTLWGTLCAGLPFGELLGVGTLASFIVSSRPFSTSRFLKLFRLCWFPFLVSDFSFSFVSVSSAAVETLFFFHFTDSI